MLTFEKLRFMNIRAAIHSVFVDCTNPISIQTALLRAPSQRREAWLFLKKHGVRA